MIGKRFGRLLVVGREIVPNKRKVYEWVCVCDCGNIISVEGHKLRNGNTRSCGCLKIDLLRQRSTKYEVKNSRIYHIWQNMKQRCTNNNHPAFPYYGGRGIVVCEDWFNNFDAFQLWALSNGYEEGLTIDRVNNNGNYEPSNCRWVTMAVQNTNKRNNKISGGKR